MVVGDAHRIVMTVAIDDDDFRTAGKPLQMSEKTR